MSETALAAARRYKRELGWAPIPVPVREKNPGFDNWQHLTIAEEELPKFFNGRPQNLGLLLGEPSGGLADTDCDAPEAIRLAPHFLPATPCRFGRPSKPRSHYLYQVEGALRTVKFVDAVPQQGGGGSQPVMLVELRFTGCQTLVPPSTHPSGEAIAWEDPDAAAAVVAAGELRAAVGQLAAATLLARHWPGQGARQETALALAGALLHAGWGEEQTGRFVGLVAGAAGDGESAKRAATSASTARAAGLGRPTTGWPRLAELLGDRVVDKAREWLGVRQPNPHNQQNPSAADEPVAWEPPAPIERYPRPDFPAACLPPVLRAFVTALATATQTPAALAALICLAVVAAAAAKRVAVKVRAGWVEPVNIMTVPALPPGNRKSAVYREATEPLVAHEAHERERLAIEIAQKQTEYRILEKRLERAQREASNGEGIEATKARADALEYAKQLAAFEVPAIPRLLVDDVSPERLATLLAEHGGRMGVFSAEGGLFETIAGRYANGVPSLDVFLKGHAGDDLRVDRVGRPPEFVTAPALTVALAVQPDVIFGLARKPGFRGRGLLARLWVALLVSTVGRRAINPPPVPDDVREDYAGLVTGILRLVPLAEQDGSPKPRLLELSYAAAARFVAFEEALEPRLGENGDLAAIADWAAKLPGAVARLAGLLHVAHETPDGNPWEAEIAGETMAAAIEVGADFLLPHALAAFAEMGADGALDDARAVLRFLARRGLATFKKRDIRMTLSRFQSSEDVDRVLSLLCDLGYVREQAAASATRKPGRLPSPTYEVNPLWLASHQRNPHYQQNPPGEPHSVGNDGFVGGHSPNGREREGSAPQHEEVLF